MTIEVPQEDDRVYTATPVALETTTMTFPDLFDDASVLGTSTPRVALPKDEAYYKKMAPMPDYGDSNEGPQGFPDQVGLHAFSRYRHITEVLPSLRR